MSSRYIFSLESQKAILFCEDLGQNVFISLKDFKKIEVRGCKAKSIKHSFYSLAESFSFR